MEFGESVEDCARREVLEETSLTLKDLRFGPYTNTVFAAEQKHYVTVFIVATREGGDPKTMEPEKCEGWVWCDWSNLPEPLFAPLAALRDRGFAPGK